MSTASTVPHISFDDWLAHEERADARHELVGGVLYVMTGARRRHNLLAGNLFGRIHSAAFTAGCRPYMADMKLRIGESGYYPDVMVACEAPPNDLYEDAPCLVAEVLSPSTEVVDRREKLAAYTAIPSVQAYLILHPDTPRIDLHRRVDATHWDLTVLGPADVLVLDCPPVELSMDALYAGVE